jgi:membrane protein DedA with SNARE-associated domain
MNLLERLWAYVTLGAMGIVWEEASPLLGGVAAHERDLALWPVIGAVALGTWLAGVLLYFVGRWRGRWVRKRWRRARPLILRSVAIVRRHPWRASLAVRFAFGLRLALPFACGVGRVPFAIYAVGTAASCIVWSVSFTALGWWLGRTTEALLGHVRNFEGVVVILIVLGSIAGYVWLRRRHVAVSAAAILDRDSGTSAS